MPIIPFDDRDRALSADSRKRELVETALVCNNCYAGDSCKHFQANHLCGLREDLKHFPKTPTACLQKIKEIINDLEERAWQNRYFEKLNGGIADKNVSEMMDSLIHHHQLLAKLYTEMLPSKNPATTKGNALLERIFGPKKNLNKG